MNQTSDTAVSSLKQLSHVGTSSRQQAAGGFNSSCCLPGYTSPCAHSLLLLLLLLLLLAQALQSLSNSFNKMENVARRTSVTHTHTHTTWGSCWRNCMKEKVII